MSQKKKNPAGGSTPDGVDSNALEGRSTIAASATADNQPVLKAVRPHPVKAGYWLATVEGHPEFTVVDKRLRSLKRFRNVIRHRFGVEYTCESREQWEVIVERAIREGGASS
jgi:hypothetical protein